MSGAKHLTLENVTVSFNGFLAVDNLSLTVGEGELRCLIGPNGAGKTTTLDLICGKTKPRSGEIKLGPVTLNDLEEHQIARKGIGRKFQVPSVFRQLTVRENLSVAHSRRPGVLRNALQLRRGEASEGLDKLAELVGLENQLETLAGHLSHGHTQWLEIALLLAQDPKLILMDEPTAGMTAQETHKTAQLFNRLKGNRTLIVVEHDMGFVKEIAEMISVMHQGKLLAEGTVEEIERHPAVREAYLGSGGISHA
ncbi:ABC transporter ATP-binding protein [Hypericibacter terrae]|uniref:ABC transporter ATP-binding protein n=1 Tax=Hypericibacter terrae TaxID=2602015 RepID=A0A5J6ML38_9PROT|nr:urea ABC transporter ATP-binding protein UrtD [Hypericibacter terrae]QEX18113.1 ABC transporter ATP-binding protein [Hypericibacter terrae]